MLQINYVSICLLQLAASARFASVVIPQVALPHHRWHRLSALCQVFYHISICFSNLLVVVLCMHLRALESTDYFFVLREVFHFDSLEERHLFVLLLVLLLPGWQENWMFYMQIRLERNQIEGLVAIAEAALGAVLTKARLKGNLRNVRSRTQSVPHEVQHIAAVSLILDVFNRFGLYGRRPIGVQSLKVTLGRVVYLGGVIGERTGLAGSKSKDPVEVALIGDSLMFLSQMHVLIKVS